MDTQNPNTEPLQQPTPGPKKNPAKKNPAKNVAIIALSVATAALLVVVALFAVRPGSSAHADPTPTPTPSVAPSNPPTPTPSPSKPAVPVVATCSVNSLKVTLGQPQGTAGSSVYPIVFTNSGSVPCELHGFPGVSMVGHGNGTQVGSPATESSAVPITANVLQPGTSVTAQLSVEIAQNVSGCTPMAVDGLRVYPPHSYASVFVPAPQLVGCTQGNISVMSVQAVAR